MSKRKSILMGLLLVSFLSLLIIFSSSPVYSCCDGCGFSCDPCKYITCQEDYYSDYYCQGDSVYKDLHSFSCTNGLCAENIISELIDECSFQCIDGSCIEEPGCSKSSDCGIDYYGGDYCLNGDAYNDFHDFSCILGECSEQTISTFHEDCGEDYNSEWNYYCDVNDVHRIREEISKGCEFGSCIESSFWRDDFVEYCEYGCEDGECSDNPEEPVCSIDSDCSSDYYSDKYCEQDNLYRDFHDFSCVEGECVKDITMELVEECDYNCKNAQCIEEPEDDDDKECSSGSKRYEGKDYCGDGFCDELNGENEVSCYSDCKTTIKRTVTDSNDADAKSTMQESKAIMLGNSSSQEESGFSIVTVLIVFVIILIIILVLLLIIKG